MHVTLEIQCQVSSISENLFKINIFQSLYKHSIINMSDSCFDIQTQIKTSNHALEKIHFTILYQDCHKNPVLTREVHILNE